MYPARCPICGEVLFDNDTDILPAVCKECAEKITPVKEPYCMRCGKQLEYEEQEYCGDCLTKKSRLFFERGVAAFSYSDAMKRSMYAFKYRNRREYASYYADTVVNRYADVIRSWNAQALIPVPLHPSKMRSRGYNQAELFARELGRRLTLPVDAACLLRVRRTRPQKLLSEADRRKNTENAFQISKKGIKYKKVILVDDIYTTGATINECAGELLSAGAVQVCFVTVCIGKGF